MKLCFVAVRAHCTVHAYLARRQVVGAYGMRYRTRPTSAYYETNLRRFWRVGNLKAH